MERTVDWFKKLSAVASNNNNSNGGVPQIGIRLTYCESEQLLNVKVIGCKELPTSCENYKPIGYSVKVTLFPGKEKFQTKPIGTCNPNFDEEHSFKLKSYSPNNLNGTFLAFTVSAILNEKEKATVKRSQSFLEKFLGNDIELRTKPKSTRSQRNSFIDTMMVASYKSLLKDIKFSHSLPNKRVSTGDIWRDLDVIDAEKKTLDGEKGSVEVSLCYNVSEDGMNDLVEVGVTKFRCNIATMRSHENLGGDLYIKITAYETEELTQKIKSDTFKPTLSLKMDSSKHSKLKVKVDSYALNHMKILIRLISKKFGQKTMVGKIEINRDSELWKEIIATPTVAVIRMIKLE